MIKICFILGSHWSYTKSGSEYQARLLMENLPSKDYKISYIYAGSKFAKTRMNGVEVYCLRRRRFLSKLGRVFFLDSLKMLRILNDIQPNIIYQRVGIAYTGIAAYYAKKNNSRMIWHVASENDLKPFQFKINRSVLFNYIDKKFLEYGIRDADYIIGQAKYQNKLLKENYGRECDLIVPNFHPWPEHEIKKDNPVKVVWISNFKKIKQPEIFIRLAEEFKYRKDTKFVMIGKPGKGDWQAELESKMNKLDNMKYLGEMPIDEVNKILSESQIFANTSEYEGFPNTFVQAWMRKVPVVSLNVNPDNILVEKNIGFCSGSFNQMARDIETLINNKELRDNMGERAQRYAFENHTLERNITKLVAFFER